jgi:hypothetical protein
MTFDPTNTNRGQRSSRRPKKAGITASIKDIRLPSVAGAPVVPAGFRLSRALPKELFAV